MDSDKETLIKFTIAKRLTSAEAVAYLQEHDITITPAAYLQAKSRIRKTAKNAMNRIAKNFGALHMDRIAELEAIGKALWKVVDNTKSDFARVKALDSLIDLQYALSSYHESTALVMEEEARFEKGTIPGS